MTVFGRNKGKKRPADDFDDDNGVPETGDRDVFGDEVDDRGIADSDEAGARATAPAQGAARRAVTDSGPYDSGDVEDLDAYLAQANFLDLGSVALPVPDGGQIQVEMGPDGSVHALHLAVAPGRITIAAYAAPKSPGQWREVIGELADTMRPDGARISIEDGPWGRELLGATDNGDMRFIGVDGPRWMIRCVVAGPRGDVGIDSPLSEVARGVLRGTVVRRGEDPMPVRDPLPVALPEALGQQLLAAQQQIVGQEGQVPEQASVEDTQTGPPAEPSQPRRGAEGSAMQQFGRRGGS